MLYDFSKGKTRGNKHFFKKKRRKNVFSVVFSVLSTIYLCISATRLLSIEDILVEQILESIIVQQRRAFKGVAAHVKQTGRSGLTANAHTRHACSVRDDIVVLQCHAACIDADEDGVGFADQHTVQADDRSNTVFHNQRRL